MIYDLKNAIATFVCKKQYQYFIKMIHDFVAQMANPCGSWSSTAVKRQNMNEQVLAILKCAFLWISVWNSLDSFIFISYNQGQFQNC